MINLKRKVISEIEMKIIYANEEKQSQPYLFIYIPVKMIHMFLSVSVSFMGTPKIAFVLRFKADAY